MPKPDKPDQKKHPLGRWPERERRKCDRRRHHDHGEHGEGGDSPARVFKELADIQRKSDLALTALTKIVELIMTVKQDFDAQTARLNTALDGIRQDIVDIKNSIPASGGMTAAETASVLADVTAVADKLAALDAENPAAPTT
jgi:hypothetical protein